MDAVKAVSNQGLAFAQARNSSVWRPSVSVLTQGCQRNRGDVAGAAPFQFAFQPIVDVLAGTTYAHEALIRGPNGESAHSVLSRVPAQLRYHFDQTARECAIRAASLASLPSRLAINCLPNSLLLHYRAIERTAEVARQFGFPMSNIVFELVEQENIVDRKGIAEVIRSHKAMGFKTAFDDFGAGYAGLTLLADFQPDIVKLDMALVRGVDSDVVRQHIVRSALAMCRDLKITVIAEGVETAGERDFFVEQGVTLMQGYLFARPAFRVTTTGGTASGV